VSTALPLIATEVKVASDPEPVKVMVCGLPVALSVIVSLPGREPVAVGVKTMLTVQEALAAKEVPQVVVSG
jgi:hypothetical protein